MKAQTSFEFLALSAFMLFVFVTFFFVIAQQSGVAKQQVRQSELQSVADAINQEVTTAYQVHDGYMRRFDIPLTINNGAYTITVSNQNEVTIRTIDNEYLVFLPTNITGQFRPGRNMINKTNGTISVGSVPQLSETDTCIFSDSGSHTCTASTGNACSGTASCSVIVNGDAGPVFWTSDCGGSATSTLDQTAENVNINCAAQPVTEIDTCVFSDGASHQCFASLGQSCTGNGCTVTLNGASGTGVTWTSDCTGTKQTTLTGTPKNINIDCAPGIEQITCLFIENPATSHTCWLTGSPSTSCTGTGSCTINIPGSLGSTITVTSNCVGNATTVITGESKNAPFFCTYQ